MTKSQDDFTLAMERAAMRALAADVPEGKRLTTHLVEAIAPLAWNAAITAASDLITRQAHDDAWRFASLVRGLLKPEADG